MDKKVKIGASYNRVSDDESASKEHGSLENQEFIGEEVADLLTRKSGIKHKIQYVLTEDEGRTGGNTDRPQYQVLWDLVETRRIDFVTAKEISRLNRSIQDFCAFMDHCKLNGVNVHIQGLDLDFNSPTGELIYKLLALIAEFELSLITQRTREGIRVSMLNNSKIHGGKVILGFDRDPNISGKWIPNESELGKIERLMDIVLSCDGYKSACKRLESEGILTKAGTPFRPDSIKRHIFNKKYEGILEVNVAVGAKDKLTKKVKRHKIAERSLGFGPVVDLAKLNASRERLTQWDDQFGNGTRLRKRPYILRDVLKAEDGSQFRGLCGTSKNGNKYYYYRNDKHPELTVDAEAIEVQIAKAISCYTDTEELGSYVKSAIDQASQNIAYLEKQIASQKLKLAKHKNSEAQLLEVLLDQPKESRSTWLDAKLKQLENDRKDLQEGLERLEREKQIASEGMPNVKDMKETLEFVFRNFDKADPAIKRNLMRQLFEKVVVTADGQIKLYWKFAKSWGPSGGAGRGGSFVNSTTSASGDLVRLMRDAPPHF